MISDDEIWKAVYGPQYHKTTKKAVRRSRPKIQVEHLNKEQSQAVLKVLKKKYQKELIKSYLCYSMFCVGYGLFKFSLLALFSYVVHFLIPFTFFQTLSVTCVAFVVVVLKDLINFPTNTR